MKVSRWIRIIRKVMSWLNTYKRLKLTKKHEFELTVSYRTVSLITRRKYLLWKLDFNFSNDFFSSNQQFIIAEHPSIWDLEFFVHSELRKKQTWECSFHVLRDFFHNKLIQFSISYFFLISGVKLELKCCEVRKTLRESMNSMKFVNPTPFHQTLIPLKKKNLLAFFFLAKNIWKIIIDFTCELWERQKT